MPIPSMVVPWRWSFRRRQTYRLTGVGVRLARTFHVSITSLVAITQVQARLGVIFATRLDGQVARTILVSIMCVPHGTPPSDKASTVLPTRPLLTESVWEPGVAPEQSFYNHRR